MKQLLEAHFIFSFDIFEYIQPQVMPVAIA